MTRTHFLLLIVIATELVGGAVFLFRQRAPYLPPVPELADAEAPVAAHIRDRAANCKTATDWAALGEVYLALGYFREGEACYRVAAEMEPENGERAYQWAFALERIGLLTEANDAYSRAIELSYPDAPGCWYFIGRNHLRLEDVNAARAAFEKAGEQPSARYELARLLVRAGKPTEATPVLTSLLARFPNAVQPPLLRHRIEALGGGTTAAAFGDKAYRVTGRLPTPFDREFQRLEAARDGVGFARDLKESEKLLAAGKTGQAETLLRKLQSENWTPSAADLLAEVEFLRGRPDEAIRILQEAIDRAGPSAHLLGRLGDAYTEARQAADAVKMWTRAVELGTPAETKDVCHRLATHLERAGDKAAANRYFARAYLGAAHELTATGRTADAKEALEEAVKHNPELAAAWFALGEVNRLKGDATGARVAYQRCLSINPDHGRAIAGLALVR